MNIVYEPEWDSLFGRLKEEKGIALIIGETDSGKSTLAKYLIQGFVSEKITISLIDADIGQSSLGLPGTISMKIFHNKKDMEDFRYEKMFFIGSINPSKKIPLMIKTSKTVAEFCRKASEMTIMDTTGLVSGREGEALKTGKINAVKPEHLIAVQRTDELEHILALVKNINIHRIKASSAAKKRSRALRISYRKNKLNDYFEKERLTDFIISRDKAVFIYNDVEFKPDEKDFIEKTIIGLNHEIETKALGIITEITEDSVSFKSPMVSLKGINRVVFSDMTMD